MHAFDVLGDPVRRRILELLTDGELPSGTITAIVQAEFGISQPAVSQHLKVLEDADLVIPVRKGRQRWNHLNVAPIQEIHERWIGPHAADAAARLAKLKREVEKAR